MLRCKYSPMLVHFAIVNIVQTYTFMIEIACF